MSRFTQSSRYWMMERLTALQARVIRHTNNDMNANCAFSDARYAINYVVNNLTRRQAKMVFPAILNLCGPKTRAELQQAANPRRVPSIPKAMREKMRRASAIITVALMLDPLPPEPPDT